MSCPTAIVLSYDRKGEGYRFYFLNVVLHIILLSLDL